MKKLLFLFILFGLFLVVSCGHKEGIIQKSDKSFLKFIGNLENVSVQIDNADPFVLKKYTAGSKDTRKKVKYENKLYQVSPGKHVVKVYRDDKLVVKRIFFLDNNVIKEVQVP